MFDYLFRLLLVVYALGFYNIFLFCFGLVGLLVVCLCRLIVRKALFLFFWSRICVLKVILLLFVLFMLLLFICRGSLFQIFDSQFRLLILIFAFDFACLVKWIYLKLAWNSHVLTIGSLFYLEIFLRILILHLYS